MKTLSPIVQLMDKTIERLEAIRSEMPFDRFCREQYNQHPHKSTHPYPMWREKYMDELNEAWYAEMEGTL
jgi:hypothetical protein